MSPGARVRSFRSVVVGAGVVRLGVVVVGRGCVAGKFTVEWRRVADGDWGAGIRTVGPRLGPCGTPAHCWGSAGRTTPHPSIADEIHLKDAKCAGKVCKLAHLARTTGLVYLLSTV